ncbi:hypothetical protein K474DRAFT_1649851 [Panus rudis PR-1116 ss-1]|nr:hypothetical protein K474DRAFT_1649851 [Panus rudis PR-1116 ss-1]
MLLPEGVDEHSAPIWSHCEIYIELRTNESHDAFSDEDGEPLESETEEGNETRSLLTKHAADLMACQHRCFLFTVEICGRRVRFLRWDRSGCTVSAYFDIYQEPEKLAAFFYQYSRLTRELRGHDPTAKIASSEEQEALQDAIKDFAMDARARGLSASQVLHTMGNECFAPHVVTVERTEEDKQDKLQFVVGMPFHDERTPCGRATRVYAAYCAETGELACLKDTWRTDDEGFQTEHDIYDTLNKAGVSHLATNLFEGHYMMQETLTSKLTLEEERPKWMKPCNDMTPRVHCRVIQQLGFPLYSAKNSKEVVAAIRDAVQCVYEARDKASILHRDLSLGNILLDKNKGGFLNDWDLASSCENMRLGRTGTWQFLSIALLQDPHKKHSVQDDVESAVWVLLNVSLHYLKLKEKPSTFSIAFFDEVRVDEAADGIPRGGRGKEKLFMSGLPKSVHWECAPLDKLIRDLTRFFGKIFVLRVFRNPDPSHFEELDKLQKDLESGDGILNIFDDALKRDDWLEHDRVFEDQFATPEQRLEKRVRTNSEKTLSGMLASQGLPSTSTRTSAAAPSPAKKARRW